MVKFEFKKQMEFYFIKYDKNENESLLASTVLDPNYKKLSYLNKTPKKANEYYSIAAEVVKQQKIIIEDTEDKENRDVQLSDSDDEKNICKTVKQEIAKYISKDQMPLSNFYKTPCESLPRLSKCVQLFLLSPATSVPSERLFSHASFQIGLSYHLHRSFPTNFTKVYHIIFL